MKKLLLVATLFTASFSCSKIMFNQLKSDKPGNSLSDNYTNYKPGRIFYYNVYQILAKDTFQFEIAAHVLPHKRLKGALMEYRYFYDKATIERYFYQGSYDSVSGALNSEKTSFKDGDWVFLHPPRSYTLKSLQLAPFPQFEKSKKEYSGKLTIPKGNWGYWENSEIRSAGSVDSILYNSVAAPQKFFISSYTVNSIYGENKAWFVYDLDSGFMDMKYQFENGNKVRIQLSYKQV